MRTLIRGPSMILKGSEAESSINSLSFCPSFVFTFSSCGIMIPPSSSTSVTAGRYQNLFNKERPYASRLFCVQSLLIANNKSLSPKKCHHARICDLDSPRLTLSYFFPTWVKEFKWNFFKCSLSITNQITSIILFFFAPK